MYVKVVASLLSRQFQAEVKGQTHEDRVNGKERLLAKRLVNGTLNIKAKTQLENFRSRSIRGTWHTLVPILTVKNKSLAHNHK